MKIKWLLLTASLLTSEIALCRAPNAAQATPQAAKPAAWQGKPRQLGQSTLKRPKRGYSQSLRIYKPSLQLAAADKGVLDDDTLFAAALLHDVLVYQPHAKAASVDLTGTIIGRVPDGPTMVRQLQGFLQAMPPNILSPAGKAMLPEQNAYLQSHLSTLAEQTHDFKAL